VRAASSLLYPRNHASNGTASSKISSQGRAKVNALFPLNQSNKFVMLSGVEASLDQTAASCAPFTNRIASSSNNSLSEVVASYFANLIRSQRFKKSTSKDLSSGENKGAFAAAVRHSME